MSIISKPNTFSPNTIISSSEVNSNFDTLYNDYNGNVSSANLATDAVTTAKIADVNVTTAKLADSAVTPAKILSGTGTNWVWQTWTPTITSTSGTFTTTSASGRYIQIGKTVNFQVTVTITTVGTGAGARFSLPVTALGTNETIGAYRERAIGGSTGVITLASATIGVFFEYDNSQSIANGWIFQGGGTYEAA
jgi:phage-related minor tail protein